MKRTEIAQLYYDTAAYDGKEVTVCGWIRQNRDSKSLGFMLINDGSCFSGVQVVFEREKIENYAETAKLNVGTAVVVTGRVVLTEQAKQPFEINASSVVVEGASTPDYPLQKKRHSVEYLRTIGHLRPRTNLYSAAFRVIRTISSIIATGSSARHTPDAAPSFSEPPDRVVTTCEERPGGPV